jgi:hypothetical protein
VNWDSGDNVVKYASEWPTRQQSLGAPLKQSLHCDLGTIDVLSSPIRDSDHDSLIRIDVGLSERTKTGTMMECGQRARPLCFLTLRTP